MPLPLPLPLSHLPSLCMDDFLLFLSLSARGGVDGGDGVVTVTCHRRHVN